jgi:hypothetical protein
MEEIYRIFVLWKSRPPQKTDPQSPTEFCDKYKISLSELREFTERPEYPDDTLNASIGWAKSKTPELIQQIYQEVKESKNVADLERFLNVIYEIKKKDKVNNQQINFYNGLSDEQYAVILKREAKLLEAGSD